MILNCFILNFSEKSEFMIVFKFPMTVLNVYFATTGPEVTLKPNVVPQQQIVSIIKLLA